MLDVDRIFARVEYDLIEIHEGLSEDGRILQQFFSIKSDLTVVHLAFLIK